MEPRDMPSEPSGGLFLLVFGFGTAAGFIAAYLGFGVVENLAGVLLLAFLMFLMTILTLGLLLVAFRRPLLRRVFGLAETQLSLFAEPLSEVARGAIDRDPDRATDAARELVQLSLARYAWHSTRRWIIGSLTALIAAMAAFAGTGLLYQQNILISAQTELLEGQSALSRMDVQLAEAARNAELVVEITAIAGELGKAADRVDAARSEPATAESRMPALDVLRDLDQALILRITAASRATKPYRFLDLGLSRYDQSALVQAAMARRADDLPLTVAGMSQGLQWTDQTGQGALIDRPASPERGQLFSTLTLSGVRAFEVLNFYGLDLSYAHAQGIKLFATSLQLAQLTLADLTFADIVDADFGGASLEQARFERTHIRRSRFDAVEGARVKGPYDPEFEVYTTSMSGVSFARSLLDEVSFSGVNGLAANFDAATLMGVRFDGASIPASTFRGAVLADVSFEGAILSSVDFDGAFVFGGDFLDRTGQQAVSGTFRPERFRVEQVDMSEIANDPALHLLTDPERIVEMADRQGVFRVVRVQPFEQ